jgi:hypothetical protein
VNLRHDHDGNVGGSSKPCIRFLGIQSPCVEGWETRWTPRQVRRSSGALHLLFWLLEHGRVKLDELPLDYSRASLQSYRAWLNQLAGDDCVQGRGATWWLVPERADLTIDLLEYRRHASLALAGTGVDSESIRASAATAVNLLERGDLVMEGMKRSRCSEAFRALVRDVQNEINTTKASLRALLAGPPAAAGGDNLAIGGVVVPDISAKWRRVCGRGEFARENLRFTWVERSRELPDWSIGSQLWAKEQHRAAALGKVREDRPIIDVRRLRPESYEGRALHVEVSTGWYREFVGLSDALDRNLDEIGEAGTLRERYGVENEMFATGVLDSLPAPARAATTTAVIDGDGALLLLVPDGGNADSERVDGHGAERLGVTLVAEGPTVDEAAVPEPKRDVDEAGAFDPRRAAQRGLREELVLEVSVDSIGLLGIVLDTRRWQPLWVYLVSTPMTAEQIAMSSFAQRDGENLELRPFRIDIEDLEEAVALVLDEHPNLTLRTNHQRVGLLLTLLHRHGAESIKRAKEARDASWSP